MTPLSVSPSVHRSLIFWILAMGYLLVYFHRLSPAVVAVDMMRDLHAGGALLGFLSSAYFYPYALMQLPAGLLSDSWGSRRTITLFFFIAFAGSLLLGLAPNASFAILGRVLVGLGVGTLFVSTLKILAEWYDPDRFAGRTGTLMAIGGVGSLLAGAPLAMISSRLGWRLSFVLVGIFTLILGMLVWVVVRDRPSASSAGSAAVRLGSDRIPLADGVKKVLGEKAFWPLAVWFFFDCAVFFSFGGLWGGPYLMQVYGLDKPHAGSVLSMLAVGIIIGSPCLGIVSGKFFRGRKPVIVMTAAMTVVLTAPLAFATARLSIPLLYLICFGIGFFTAAAAVIGFASVKELYPGGMAGTSTGILNIFPFAGGALFQPLLGWVLEGYHRSGGGFAPEGYGAAFRILFGCAVVSLLAGLLTRETIRAK